MKPHKHAELIKAWADGSQIQYFDTIDDVWRDIDMANELWFEHAKYRIKPEEKKPVVRWLWAYENESNWAQFYKFMTEKEAGITFEKQKHKKLEYTRTEFEE